MSRGLRPTSRTSIIPRVRFATGTFQSRCGCLTDVQIFFSTVYLSQGRKAIVYPVVLFLL